MSKFRFDPEKHEYWLGEWRLPSVTEILHDVGLVSQYSIDEDAALRGTYVHKACALLLAGDLDWNSIDDRIAGYVKSFQLWFNHCGFDGRDAKVETPGYHASLLYAGTPDLILAGALRKFAPLLVDLKSGTPADWHKLQTAAYLNLDNGVFCLDRATVYLNKDGKMPLHKTHDSPADWQDFKACLRVYQLKRRI